MTDTIPIGPQDASRLARGAVFAGHRIESEIGRGGMGVVYRAHHVALDRERALKLISPALSSDDSFRKRFRREGRIAASLEHPNVVPGYDAGEEDGVLYLSMRLVEGADLRQVVAGEGPLPLERVAHLIRGVAAGLDAAHDRGLLHRDVKPANVLIEPARGGERVFLSDFGISRLTGGEGAGTSSRELLGSVDYVAPEQIDGLPGDRRVDVYSLGCVLHFAATGQPPFPRETDLARLYAHANAPRPRPSDLMAELPTELDDVVGRAMARDADDRYATAGALANDLERVASGNAPAQVRGPVTGPAGAEATDDVRRWFRPRPWAAVTSLAVLAAAAAAVGAVALIGSGDRATSPSGAAGSQARALATVRVGPDPVGLSVAGGKVWVASRGSGAVDSIDSATDRPASSPLDVGGAPVSVATGFGSIWVVNATTNSLLRLNPGRGTQPVAIPVGETPSDVAVDQHWVWVADKGSNSVSRIDPASSRVDETISVGAAPSSIASGAGRVWVTNLDGGSVTEIDPERARVTGKPIAVGDRPNDLAVGDGYVWVSDVFNGTVTRIDSGSARVVGQPIAVGARPRGVTTGSGSVWVANGGDGTVSRLDPEAGKVVGEPVSVGANPADIAVGGGTVWTANSDDATVTKIKP